MEDKEAINFYEIVESLTQSNEEELARLVCSNGDAPITLKEFVAIIVNQQAMLTGMVAILNKLDI